MGRADSQLEAPFSEAMQVDRLLEVIQELFKHLFDIVCCPQSLVGCDLGLLLLPCEVRWKKTCLMMRTASGPEMVMVAK